ncbi:MAG TPA: haloacid dehalogenase-like hydrolase [Myxococcales bacterium]|nr:haloacid dehalogenase-like hydrolase [Myxococcales bacterium]
MKVAESLLVLGEPVGFRALCERFAPAGARYFVFDLDRTLHYGRNIGELLGWELTAVEGYGGRYLSKMEPARRMSRFHLEWKSPWLLARYLAKGMAWIPPGLRYWWWCRVASAMPALRRRAFARFGDEPVAAVQRFPQEALFRQMARHPQGLPAELVRRLLQRYRGDRIVEREDLDWLRARWPGARVILSSASPQQVVETVAEAFGFDEALFSTPARINGGAEKVAALLERHPDLPRCESVGFSDNAYGEDAAWTSAFSHLAAVNGATPFSLLAPDGAPLRKVCSAQVLTRAERSSGLPDRRRRRPGARIELYGAELEAMLAPFRAAADAATGAYERLRVLEAASGACRGRPAGSGLPSMKRRPAERSSSMACMHDSTSR